MFNITFNLKSVQAYNFYYSLTKKFNRFSQEWLCDISICGSAVGDLRRFENLNCGERIASSAQRSGSCVRQRGRDRKCGCLWLEKWLDRECCALSGGRKQVRWRRGEVPSLRGLERLCPGPTAQCWPTFNPPLIPQRDRLTLRQVRHQPPPSIIQLDKTI